MKIAFLNPWRNAAENQAFQSLRLAASRIGHELVHCASSDEVENSAVDFVLATASTQPKLNDVPHYGVIHEPRDRFLANRAYFNNLLTYDGYLTIFGNLERFLKDICSATGRTEDVGRYYNTCQRQAAVCDLESLLGQRGLRITYAGTNWDRRRQGFFRRLSEMPQVEIVGPKHSWPDIQPAAYGGTPDFDGNAMQARYAANGIGLCVASDLHFRDDIISNRLFEIVSVGAIVICCDMPWVRNHFGDSVYYFDQTLGDEQMAEAVEACRVEIYRSPEAAVRRAAEARKTFEEKFAAEVLLGNAVQYHERLQAARRLSLSKAKSVYEPLISIVVRCGGRPLEFVERAVHSIDRQSYGKFQVILVRYKAMELSAVAERAFSNIQSIRVVDCAGGARSTALWAGLRNVEGEYAACLDDDDILFSDHFERLFQPFPQAAQQRFFAYSGAISESPDPEDIDGGGKDRRALAQFGTQNRSKLTGVSAGFASNCFVASRDLLDDFAGSDPAMHTAEDSYLILSLLGGAAPKFSYSATSLYAGGRADQSDFANDPRRFEDELTLATRLFGARRPACVQGDGWEELRDLWVSRGKPVPAEAPLRPEQRVSSGYEPAQSAFSGSSRGVDANGGSARIETPAAPWGYGAELALQEPREISESGFLLVIELRVDQGPVGAGLLDATETEFLFRTSLEESAGVQQVRIPFESFERIGRLVIQTWDIRGPMVAELCSVQVYRR